MGRQDWLAGQPQGLGAGNALDKIDPRTIGGQGMGMASVTKRPNGRWRARYRDRSGREHARHFGRRVDAESWLGEANAALVTGTWTSPERGKATVEVWAEQWVATQTQLKESTAYRYRSLLRAHIIPQWGTRRLIDISHAEVATWVAQMAQVRAPSTVRQAHRVFSLLMALAVRDQRIPHNPAEGVRGLPKPRRPEARFISRAQVEELADAAGTDSDVIRLLALTGLRFGEMAALRVRDVDFLRRRLTVEQAVTEVGGKLVFGSPKSHQQRRVGIPRSLVEQLSARCARKGPDDLVFTSPKGGAIRLRNFRRTIFNPATQAVGLSDFTPHDLRDTAASIAISAGANVKQVQNMLGHASAAMTLDVYAGLFEDDVTALADRIDNAGADSLRTARTVVDHPSSQLGL